MLHCTPYISVFTCCPIYTEEQTSPCGYLLEQVCEICIPLYLYVAVM